MSMYTLALFAHILGVLGLFIGLGLQWTITYRLRRAQTVAQVREWSALLAAVGSLGPVTGVVVVVAGAYMALSAGLIGAAWIVVSLAAMLLMMVFGMGVAGRQLMAIRRTAAAIAPAVVTIPDGLRRPIHQPVLWVAMQLAGSTELGIVFLMTARPGLGGSLLAVGVGLAVGALVGLASAKPGHGAQAAKPSARPHVSVD